MSYFVRNLGRDRFGIEFCGISADVIDFLNIYEVDTEIEEEEESELTPLDLPPPPQTNPHEIKNWEPKNKSANRFGNIYSRRTISNYAPKKIQESEPSPEIMGFMADWLLQMNSSKKFFIVEKVFRRLFSAYHTGLILYAFLDLTPFFILLCYAVYERLTLTGMCGIITSENPSNCV
ncbi:hypothetical protein KFK09_011466 [Dendrobium nobile]|uniref:Uncharacterized protein n=1 Tax=Dendrobium nobile TaxID=94219 RepID=A0A8T3BCZ0_DENNO|nr:hypothetical protein KFK09_011466 [Dendrobium nobile]